MIKFFRKIRQELLNENKFRKYVLYAIGEIILVVIGILIALQINNRNESKIRTQKEVVILTQMQSNLKDDLKDLEYNIENNKMRLECNEIIRKVIEEKTPFSDTLKPYFGTFFGNFQLLENRSAWENLKSIGLDLISNDSLRNNVSNLYSTKYEYLESLEKGFDDKFQWDYLYPKVMEHISFDKVWVSGKPRHYEKWINDPEFYEVLKMNIFSRNIMQNQYEQNYELVLVLEKQIDNHLKSLIK